MFVARAAICFERFKDVHPFGELRFSFVQAIPREVRILHFPTRDLHIVAREQMHRPTRRGYGVFSHHLCLRIMPRGRRCAGGAIRRFLLLPLIQMLSPWLPRTFSPQAAERSAWLETP